MDSKPYGSVLATPIQPFCPCCLYCVFSSSCYRGDSAELFDTYFHAWPITLHWNFFFCSELPAILKMPWACQALCAYVCARIRVDSMSTGWHVSALGDAPVPPCTSAGPRSSSARMRGAAAAPAAPGGAGRAMLPLSQAVPAMLRGGGGVSAVGDTRGHCLSSIAASFWDNEQN